MQEFLDVLPAVGAESGRRWDVGAACGAEYVVALFRLLALDAADVRLLEIIHRHVCLRILRLSLFDIAILRALHSVAYGGGGAFT